MVNHCFRLSPGKRWWRLELRRMLGDLSSFFGSFFVRMVQVRNLWCTCHWSGAVNVAEVGILHEKLTSLGSPGTRVWSEMDLIWSDNILGVENPFCRICDKFCQMSVWTWMPWMAGLLGTPPKPVALANGCGEMRHPIKIPDGTRWFRKHLKKCLFFI